VCLNVEEAEREQRRRNEIPHLLQLELERLGDDQPKAACRLVASKRFGPYLSLDDQGRPRIDPAKVKAAERLDGKFVLTTNDDTLSVADIALGYKGMWIIEACFRQLKTTGPAVGLRGPHSPEHPPDVPLDAAADRGPRQALRPRPDDPARGRARRRGAVVAPRGRPRAPESGPLHL
jgi:hypothetical protein